MPNYEELMNVFPDTSRFIKILEGGSFTGRFTNFNAPEVKNFGNGDVTLYKAMFACADEKGSPMDRELSCGKALMQAFQATNVQEGDTIKIERKAEAMTDADGNEVKNEDGSPRTFTKYVITVLEKETKSKKTESKEEVNIDDIPF